MNNTREIQTAFINALAYLLISTFFFSCNNNSVLDKFETVENMKWTYDDAKTFEAEITDTTVNYNIDVQLRHSFQFEWRNLWVNIETTFPNGKVYEKRVNLQLSEADGVWFAKCLGDNCDIQIPIQQNAFFPLTGKYTFKISQDMRANPINYIKSVGMKIEKAKP